MGDMYDEPVEALAKRALAVQEALANEGVELKLRLVFDIMAITGSSSSEALARTIDKVKDELG